jgi:hypothetical protein
MPADHFLRQSLDRDVHLAEGVEVFLTKSHLASGLATFLACS